MPLQINARKPPRPASKKIEAEVFGLPKPPPGWAQLPPGVSLCMIVRNEERFLAQCLESVREAVDEINILDTGSTDRTLEIAASFGARVERCEWRNDFSWARNRALGMATKRWILVLDADEELTAESIPLLRGVGRAPAHLTGVWVRCRNEADDYEGTGTSSHAIARLFPNNGRLRYTSPVHEFVTLDGTRNGIDARKSDITILHYGYLKAVVSERNKADRNLEIIRAATREHPDDPFQWYNLGTTSFLVGNFDEGIAALEQMRSMLGDQGRGYLPAGLAFLSDAYLERGDPPERALEAARASLEKSPHFANGHFALGKALVKLGRAEEARAAYQEAIADGEFLNVQFLVDDEVPAWKAHAEIGQTFVREGNLEAALEWYEKALANRPSVRLLQSSRAKALEALNRYPEAEDAFHQLYRQSGDESSTVEYVNFLLRRQRYASALEIIRESVDRFAGRSAVELLVAAAAASERAGFSAVEPWLLRAQALAPGSARVLDALESFYAARGMQPELERLRRDELAAPCIEPADFARRASRWLVEGDAQRALEAALQGLALAPTDPRHAYNAAAASVQLGDREGAAARLATVDRSDPETFLKAAFLRSVVLGDLGRVDEALLAIGVVLEENPAQVDAVLQRFRLLEQAGLAAEAESELRAAMAPGNQRIGVELAAFLLRLGRFEEAKTAADQALSHG